MPSSDQIKQIVHLQLKEAPVNLPMMKSRMSLVLTVMVNLHKLFLSECHSVMSLSAEHRGLLS